MKPPPLPSTLYYVEAGRVQLCLTPAKSCSHEHHFFLAVAAQAVAKTFFKNYHINADGEVARCNTFPVCDRAEHYQRRWEAVKRHRETYDFTGPWRAKENPYVSFLEKEVADFIELLGYPIVRNSRSVIGPYEVDVYVPSRGVAIEFNGDYWHSEEQIQLRKNIPSRSYHLNKYTLCEQQKIVLGFVWEQNWLQDWLTVVDALSDLLQFKRHTSVLEQFERAMPPSDFYWESVDRKGSLAHRIKVEKRLKKHWNVS